MKDWGLQVVVDPPDYDPLRDAVGAEQVRVRDGAARGQLQIGVDMAMTVLARRDEGGLEPAPLGYLVTLEGGMTSPRKGRAPMPYITCLVSVWDGR